MIRSKSFYRHLQDAIAVNQQRKGLYAQLSAGQSVSVSTRLILLEQLLLPLALYFDWQAKRFNQQGIPIIADDFVSMASIRDAREPPRYQNVGSKQQLQQVKSAVQQYGNRVSNLVAYDQFEAVCRATAAMLTTVATVEISDGVHFAMLTHLLESIGYGASNAIRYSTLSHGATAPLSRYFLKIHLSALGAAVKFDGAAQAIHRLGIGIIVNDLPVIPFPAYPLEFRH